MRLAVVIFFCFIHAIQAAYLNIDTNGNVKSPTNFPKFLLLSGNNFTAQPTNTPDGWAIRGHATGGGAGATNWSAGNTTSVRVAVVSKGTNNTGAIKTISVSGTATVTEEGDTNLVIGASGGSGGDQYSQGSMLLSNLTANPYNDYTNKAMQVAANNVLSNLQTMAFFYWTNAQASAMLLSNLVNNPYVGYTNKAMQVAANNALSNLQTMATFYWTNAQASAMLLSNLVNNPYTGYTNLYFQIAANNVLSNLQTMATFYWTNSQASAMLLSNLVNNPYTGYTNKNFQVAANNVLSNLQTMASFYWTNAQASSMVLSNLASNPYTGYTNLAMQVAANNVLSNLQTMASFYWTNSQASSIALSNIAGLSPVDGDFIVRTNSTWSRLPKGTANQVIKMDATGTFPRWGPDDGGTGSQTPWTSDIDGATFALTNVGDAQFSGAVRIADDLSVNGVSVTNGLTVGASATISNSLTVSNITGKANPLRFTSDSNYLNGPTFITNNLTVQSNLSVVGSMDVSALNTPVLNVTNDITASNAALGYLTVSNTAAINLVSNLANVKWKPVVPGITESNLVLSFLTNRYYCDGLTNLVLTNIVEEAHATASADMSIFVRNTNGVNCALRWPAYGAQHGYFFRTNINNPVLAWAAVTNAKSAVISLTCWGTNVFATITEWP